MCCHLKAISIFWYSPFSSFSNLWLISGNMDNLLKRVMQLYFLIFNSYKLNQKLFLYFIKTTAKKKKSWFFSEIQNIWNSLPIYRLLFCCFSRLLDSIQEFPNNKMNVHFQVTYSNKKIFQYPGWGGGERTDTTHSVGCVFQ